MVDFFFVLSGFVIALNYQDKITNFEEFKIFLIKRFARLYPLHLIMLFCFLGFEILKYLVEIELGMVATNKAFTTNDSIAFLYNVFLVQNWLLINGGFNTVSWSISAEFYTYAIFGLLLLTPKIINGQLITISLFLTFVSGLFLFKSGFAISDAIGIGPSRCIYSFFLGIITFNIYRYYSYVKIHSSFLALITLFLCLTIISLSEIEMKNRLILIIPFIFCFFILSLVLTAKDTVIYKFLSNQKLVYLGTISYGIYMIHSSVWWIINQILKFFFGLPTQGVNGSTIAEIQNKLHGNLLIIVGLIFIIYLSHISYNHFERLFYKNKHSSK